MIRSEFHHRFACSGPVVMLVIHMIKTDQVLRNLDHVAASGAAGAFLIHHDFGRDRFLPIMAKVRKARPDQWFGVNFRAEDGRVGFAEPGRLADQSLAFQALRADDACLDERMIHHPLAEEIAKVRAQSG